MSTPAPRLPGELIDIGVNLVHRSFHDDRDAVLARAQAQGVAQLVVTGTSVAASREAVALSARHPGVLFATAGVHPHDAARCDAAALAELRALAQRPEVVAVGECGLDFNRNFSPRPVQEAIFAAQIELGIEVGKPLFLHERDAHETLLTILDRHRAGDGKFPIPAVVHCFTGGARALCDYLSRGFYIGITGWICDERRGRELQELIRQVPLDRLMLETDAPFLMPRDLQPKLAAGRNEPATLAHIARTIARLIDRPFAELCTVTTQNARRFFRLA
jgi:TatD DNase family protein